MRLYLINLISFGLRHWGYIGQEQRCTIDNIHKYITPDELNEIKVIIKNKNNQVILYAVSEGWAASAIETLLQLLEVTTETKNVKLILDTCAIEWIDNNHLSFPVVYYSHDLMKVVNYEDQYGNNTVVDLNTNKFLYLVGKPYKPHRIRLLYNLYREGLLANCEWSFKLTDAMYQKTRNLLPELNESAFRNFIDDTLRNLDDIDSGLFGSDRFVHEGIPYDHTMYAKTSFSLISETLIIPKCITEKTWRAISNRHAFVTLGNTEFFDWLNGIGLDTFDNLRVHDNNNHFLDNGISSVKMMLENISDSRLSAAISIEHNYQVYRDIASKFRSQVDETIEPYMVQSRQDNPTRVIMLDSPEIKRAIDKLW